MGRKKATRLPPSTETCEGCHRFLEYGECPIGLPKLQVGQRCFHFVPAFKMIGLPAPTPSRSVYLIDILGKDKPE